MDLDTGGASLSLVSRLGGVDGVYHTNSQEATGRLDEILSRFPSTGVYPGDIAITVAVTSTSKIAPGTKL